MEASTFVSPVSFGNMVLRLFNTSVPGNKWTPLMHAAIGVVGEVLELKNAVNNKNLIEELGDVEFYVESARQSLAVLGYTDVLGYDDEQGLRTFGEPWKDVISTLENRASDLLDLAKKGWVYNKDISLKDVAFNLEHFQLALSDLYIILGVTRQQVLNTNMEKLIGPKGRFRDGFYSDKAAQERADKDGQE